MHHRNSILVFLLLLTGCVSTQFETVEDPTTAIEKLQVNTTDLKWNRAPGTAIGHLPKGSQLWTRDGLLLDQVQLIGPIGHEQAIYVSNNESLVFPTYRKKMLPNEIKELVVSTLTKRYGSGSLVEGLNLRPHRVDGERALMFDITVVSSERPRLKGVVSAVKFEDKLYLMVYIAAGLHYHEKHAGVAAALMDSARFSRME